MTFYRTVASICLLAGLATLSSSAQTRTKVQKSDFGKVDGQQVYLYTMKNANGMEVAVTNYGATVVSIKVPDKNGKIADVALGYDNVQGYVNGTTYFGATPGRYANRIANGQFTLDGKKYQITRNDGPNALHGGKVGFNKRIWKAKELPGNAVEMTYLSPNGEEGFPGDLNAVVTFTLTNKNELRFDYLATTDRDTVVNLTNHTYFNLDGEGNGNILGTELKLNASKFTPVNATLIPTGELRSVKGTPFDFTTSHTIGERIKEQNEQLKLGHGYDHNFVLDRSKPGLILAAEAYDPRSGRVLDVYTDQPGVQFYTGNFLDGTQQGKGGVKYAHRGGFCLETQHFPDSPNQPKFPSTELKPGQKYATTTIFKFSTR